MSRTTAPQKVSRQGLRARVPHQYHQTARPRLVCLFYFTRLTTPTSQPLPTHTVTLEIGSQGQCPSATDPPAVVRQEKIIKPTEGLNAGPSAACPGTSVSAAGASPNSAAPAAALGGGALVAAALALFA